MAAMMAAVTGYANDTSLPSIDKDEKRTAVYFNNVKQGNLLSIKDANGVILYKELIEQTGRYSKGFDLTALPNGNYIFELEKDLEIRTIPFSVTFNAVAFKKEQETVVFKPYTRVKGNLAMVSKLSLTEAPLDIKVYYEDETINSRYELVHKENIKNTRIIEKVFKLPKEGRYKLVFESEGRVFTEYINN